MTARKMILLTLAVLLPCGFVILLARSALRSSLGEKFLKGATPMRKLAFLGSSLTTGNNVVLRGLLFKTAGDPILVAKKIRKR